MINKAKGPDAVQRLIAAALYLIFILAAFHFGWTSKWKVIATWVLLVYQFPVLGEYVSRAVLTIIYLAAFPFGLGVRLFSDPLRLRFRREDTHWLNRPAPDESLPGASRQG